MIAKEAKPLKFNLKSQKEALVKSRFPALETLVYLGGFIQPFFFVSTPIPGEISQFDEHILQMGWFNHHLVNVFRFHVKTLPFIILERLHQLCMNIHSFLREDET